MIKFLPTSIPTSIFTFFTTCTTITCIKDIQCPYGGKCRETFINYEVKCKETGRRYIGTTQQTFKNRMAGHFNDIQKMITKNLRSDSLATHFSNILPKNKNYQDKNYVH